MRVPLVATFPLPLLMLLAACASQPETAGSLGKVLERKIVSTTMERSAYRPQVPIRERAMSSQSFQESTLRPVYEHLIALEDGRTLRVQTTNPAHAAGSCVRVLEGEGAPKLVAGSGCK